MDEEDRVQGLWLYALFSLFAFNICYSFRRSFTIHCGPFPLALCLFASDYNSDIYAVSVFPIKFDATLYKAG